MSPVEFNKQPLLNLLFEYILLFLYFLLLYRTISGGNYIIIYGVKLYQITFDIGGVLIILALLVSILATLDIQAARQQSA